LLTQRCVKQSLPQIRNQQDQAIQSACR